jgi:hypothetical protein
VKKDGPALSQEMFGDSGGGRLAAAAQAAYRRGDLHARDDGGKATRRWLQSLNSRCKGKYFTARLIHFAVYPLLDQAHNLLSVENTATFRKGRKERNCLKPEGEISLRGETFLLSLELQVPNQRFALPREVCFDWYRFGTLKIHFETRCNEFQPKNRLSLLDYGLAQRLFTCIR